MIPRRYRSLLLLLLCIASVVLSVRSTYSTALPSSSNDDDIGTNESEGPDIETESQSANADLITDSSAPIIATRTKSYSRRVLSITPTHATDTKRHYLPSTSTITFTTFRHSTHSSIGTEYDFNTSTEDDSEDAPYTTKTHGFSHTKLKTHSMHTLNAFSQGNVKVFNENEETTNIEDIQSSATKTTSLSDVNNDETTTVIDITTTIWDISPPTITISTNQAHAKEEEEEVTTVYDITSTVWDTAYPTATDDVSSPLNHAFDFIPPPVDHALHELGKTVNFLNSGDLPVQADIGKHFE
jgi:hypothetical protein